MKPEYKQKILKYLTGYASAQRMMLWNRQGEDGFAQDREHRGVPGYYWCASIRIDGKQHGVVGPNGYIGQYSRKEAVAEAQAFLDRCRRLLDEEASQPEASASSAP